MAKGKYNPTMYTRDMCVEYIYNAKGEITPATWADSECSEEIHFGDYDSEGFDSYGYSAYDADGKFVGLGRGVDRNGITEDQYSCMSDEEYEQY